MAKNLDLLRQEIIFCYIHPLGRDFIPLELGYFLSKKTKNEKRFNFKMAPLFLSEEKHEEKENTLIENTKLILGKKSRAIFFWLDNELWTGFFPLNYFLKIVCLIKKHNENIFVVFVSKRKDQAILDLILQNNLVDCFLQRNDNQGLELIEGILAKKKMDGVFYKEDFLSQSLSKSKKNQTKISQNSFKIRRDDYVDTKKPSPYLSNVLKLKLLEIKKENRKSFFCPIFSSRGCGFGCHYCFRSVKFEKIQLFSPERFFDEVEYLVALGFLNFFVADDVFSLKKERLQSLLLEFIRRKTKNKSLENVSFYIMTRIEEFEDEKCVEILHTLQVKRVQIGLQTIHPKLDFLMKREKGTVQRLVIIKAWLDKWQIKTNLDIILGLPNDTIFYAKKTIDFALALNPAHLQIKQLYLNSNTLLACQRDRYKIKTENIKATLLGVPFVESAVGEVGPKYFEVLSQYCLEKLKNSKQISYRVTLQNLKKLNLI
jgi:hypothetical protein